jgi:TonB family protein
MVDMTHNLAIEQKREGDRKKALIVSLTIHVLLLLLFFIPWAVEQIQEDETSEGIEVNYGFSMTGAGSVPPTNTIEENNSELMQSEASEAAISEENAITQSYEENVNMNDNNPKNADAVVVNNATSNEEKNNSEVQTLSPELQAMLDKMKNAGGQGDDETGPFDKGAPDGNPESDNYGPKNYGKGDDGFGYELAGRGVVYIPPIENNSQKYGKVVVKIKVDAAGNVTEATFQATGSTTNDSYLIAQAVKAAKQTRFSEQKNGQGFQWGTITINFKLK